MTRRPPLVLNVSLLGADRDYDEVVTFLHHRYRIKRIGVGGDVAAAHADIVAKLRAEALSREKEIQEHRRPAGTL